MWYESRAGSASAEPTVLSCQCGAMAQNSRLSRDAQGQMVMQSRHLCHWRQLCPYMTNCGTSMCLQATSVTCCNDSWWCTGRSNDADIICLALVCGQSILDFCQQFCLNEMAWIDHWLSRQQHWWCCHSCANSYKRWPWRWRVAQDWWRGAVQSLLLMP